MKTKFNQHINHPTTAPNGNLRASLIVGGVTVLMVFLETGIFCLRAPLSLKIYTSLVLVVFLLSATWYYRRSHWETRLRRLTATSLHSLGVLLILKAVASQTLQNIAFGGRILLSNDDKSSISANLLLTAVSTSWQWDVGMATLGFFMLLGVSFFTKSHNSRDVKSEKSMGRRENEADRSVHVNVVQILGDQKSSPTHLGAEKVSFDNKFQSFNVLQTYDSDLPPLVDVWVGRESEICLFDEVENGVVAITGIGGQGKSSLAAKSLELKQKKCPSLFWDWRDCREEANRFRTHLVSVIEHYTHGDVSASMVADADVTWLTKFLFRKLGHTPAVIIFDNVDHYVDIDQSWFISDISTFINEALRVDHKALVIFTCRPRISYASVRFREVYLRGLSLDETVCLFSQRIPGGLKEDLTDTVKRLHCLNGDYTESLIWSNRGIQLKKKGGVDTPHNCDHIQALAWRDSGEIEKALQVFLGGNELAGVVNDDHIKSKRDASFYGNIGRCLYLKGEVKHAILLYSKSYDILDRHEDAVSILNRGYAALWIGEALSIINRQDEAVIFLKWAAFIWRQRAPHKADIPEQMLKKIGKSAKNNGLSDDALRETCKEWIIDHLKPPSFEAEGQCGIFG